MDDPSELLFIIGGKEDLSPGQAAKSAHGVKLAAELYPDAPVTISIDGYDDDPRELWEIDEVRYFVTLFAAELQTIGYPPRLKERLTDASIKWGNVA